MASELTVQTIKGPTSGANANKIIVPSGHTLAASGHVIQVKNIWSSDQVSSTTAGYIDLGLDIVITPTSTSSQFLLFGSIHGDCNANGSGFGFGLYRGATRIATEDLMAYTPTAGWRLSCNVSYMDEPNTTSSITYKYQPNQFGTAQVRYNETYRSRSSFTVMEIAQ